MGRLGGVLGASWGVLGASWGRLGVVLGHLGAVVKLSWGRPWVRSRRPRRWPWPTALAGSRVTACATCAARCWPPPWSWRCATCSLHWRWAAGCGRWRVAGRLSSACSSPSPGCSRSHLRRLKAAAAGRSTSSRTAPRRSRPSTRPCPPRRTCRSTSSAARCSARTPTCSAASAPRAPLARGVRVQAGVHPRLHLLIVDTRRHRLPADSPARALAHALLMVAAQQVDLRERGQQQHRAQHDHARDERGALRLAAQRRLRRRTPCR